MGGIRQVAQGRSARHERGQCRWGGTLDKDVRDAIMSIRNVPLEGRDPMKRSIGFPLRSVKQNGEGVPRFSLK